MPTLPDYIENDMDLIIERLEEAERKAEEIVALETSDVSPFESLGLAQAKGAILKVHAHTTREVALTLRRKLHLIRDNVPEVTDIDSLEVPSVPRSCAGARIPDPVRLALGEAIKADQKERRDNGDY